MKALVFTAALVVALAGAAPAPPRLGDPQILTGIRTFDDAEIAAARLALAKSRDPKVKAYARLMVDDHTALNATIDKLTRKLKFAPSPSAVSAGLERDAALARKRLTEAEGQALDRAYVAAEIASHRRMDRLLTDTVLRSARNFEVKGLAQQAQDLFRVHLHEAQQLAGPSSGSVSPGPGSTARPAPAA
jgi:putative membrane protein